MFQTVALKISFCPSNGFAVECVGLVLTVYFYLLMAKTNVMNKEVPPFHEL